MDFGIFAIYQGIEYSAGVNENGQISLRSNDKESVRLGFELYLNRIYIKRVTIDQVESIYSKETQVTYLGGKFIVINKSEDKILVQSIVEDHSKYINLGFEQVERGVYQKWIYLSEVDAIQEIREDLQLGRR